ncbi:MAG: heterodisulfide reductase subunit C [Firmicutes bacterium]|nr:heterodisulfide reductase subunit C [Bacillota bacterium]
MSEFNLSQALETNRSFVDKVIAESGQDIRQCYQCAKCSGGCPGTFAMDYLPNQIMRMLMLGMKEEVLKSQTIWVCMACNTCTTRCIRDIDVARVMDTLRQEAVKHGYTEKGRLVLIFNDVFLGTVRSYGRLFEAGLLMMNNMRTGNLMKDMQFGLPMMLKGKAKPFPHRIKGRKEIRKIFEETRRREGK